jgi:glutamyl-Q tRNA(Asp) synthetase
MSGFARAPGPRAYVGRFAPSPTGPLHAGSIAAALASWLDARAHGGRWLVRMEDIDGPRCVPGADREILRQLAHLGLLPDAPVLKQSSRDAAYQAALEQLKLSHQAYPCACTRQDIARALTQQGMPHRVHTEWVYPGTCRCGLHGRAARAWRFLTTHQNGQDRTVKWEDRRLGPQHQNVTQAVGDFVVRRADQRWAYQLAVVVDDAAQGITHVVRGEDLADNTPRQILLQQALGLSTPRYLHTPLVMGPDGQKLSKQHGAPAAPTDTEPLAVLRQAGRVLGLPQALTTDETRPGDGTAAAGSTCQHANRSTSRRSGTAQWLAQAVLAWGQGWQTMAAESTHQEQTP